MKFKTTLLVFTLFLAISCKKAPEKVSVYKQNLFPEGITWWEDEGVFLLSSMSEGTIYQVEDEGQITPLIQDDDLMSSVGIRVNNENNRLYVCNSHPGVANARTKGKNKEAKPGTVAAVAVYDLDTKKRIQYIDLIEFKESKIGQFCNDITFDNQNNAYVTNSFVPVVYKITENGEASIFIEDEDLQGKAGEFHLNGIVYHPKGFLLVARHFTGEIFKVDLKDPSFEKVNVSGVNLNDADGLVLKNPNQLIVVSNNFTGKGSDAIHTLQTSDDWNSATLANSSKAGWSSATTATIRKEKVYVINALLHLRFQGKPQASYDIRMLK